MRELRRINLLRTSVNKGKKGRSLEQPRPSLVSPSCLAS